MLLNKLIGGDLKKILLLFFFLSILSAALFSQTTGRHSVYKNMYGINTEMLITVPELCENSVQYSQNPPFIPSPDYSNSSYVRWNLSEATGIGNDVAVSGNGLISANGWSLNNQHLDVYGNANNTPLWQYGLYPSGYRNYVATSDTGGLIAVGAYKNILFFDKGSNTPFFNFDLTTTGDTGTASFLDVTSNGSFVVAGASRSDSSKILGFAKGSSTYSWRVYIPGGQIYGVRISGNDSLVIVSTYSNYMVLNTFTGVVRAQGTISYGTQCAQGISGNGNIIATVNYHGQVRVMQWNGSAYVQLWQYQEPTGTYYNWINCIDISNDGNYIAAGTLNFLPSSTYDGKVRFFKVSNGNTPIWSYQNTGDEISAICFSKNGKVLAAVSYGPMDYSKDNIFVFQANPGDGIPVFTTKSSGSPFACSLSDDGTTLVTAGKAVHARIMGSGGNVYNIFVDTNFTPSGIINIPGVIPAEYSLHQNYPNPFNPVTKIKFDVPVSGSIRISVYNSTGELVRTLMDGYVKRGSYETYFDGSGLGSGIYYSVMASGNRREVIKMALIK